MFEQLKAWLKTEEVEDYQFGYDDPYADYINGLYGDAVGKLQKETGDESIFVEPSIQCGRGCVVMYTEDGRSQWDFESECETLLEFAEDADTEEELIACIKGYLNSKYEDRSQEDEEDDDEMEEEEE